MDMGSHLGQKIRGPIPAERGLQNDLRLGAGRGHRSSHGQRIVIDVNLRQQLALGVLADNHRTAAVQVDTDILSLHGNLLSS